MRMKIRVSQDHINRGELSDSYCPVALAIREAVPPGRAPEGELGSDPSVWESRISLVIDGARVRIRPPVRVTKFIRRFDRGGAYDVKPFNFFLDVTKEAKPCE